MKFQIIVFIDGSKTSIFLLNSLIKVKEFFVKLIVLSPSCKDIVKKKLKKKFKRKIKILNLKNYDVVRKLKSYSFDIGFSYYNKKIHDKILKSLKIGGINFHPSYLPYNKGRHSVFWAINNKTPFGATAHWLDENFDTGDILLRRKINFDNFENAYVIYNEQIRLLRKIIIDSIELIRNKKFIRIKQSKNTVDYHFAKDIKKRSIINLYKKISNSKLANLIRSTSYNNKTGFYIKSKNNVYFILSKYTVKKTKNRKKHLININEIFKDIENNVDRFKYKIYLDKFEININSKAKVIKSKDQFL